MLAHLADKPFDSQRHIYEIKWDGIRCLALIDADGRLILQSRNFKDITYKFPELAELPNNIRSRGVILDGELVVLDQDAKPSFRLIQKRVRATTPGVIVNYAFKTPATFMLFDLLYKDGQELCRLPLTKRKALLEDVVDENERWVVTKSITGLGQAYAKIVFAQGFEGVMAKDSQSPYLPGKRSEFWLKIKNTQRLVATIIGFTASNQATEIKALVLAQPDETGELHYIGRVGTGFDTKTSSALLQMLAKDLIPAPVLPVPEAESGTWWVKPLNRCQVEYLEFTADGVLRHPVFRGLVKDEC